MKKSCLVPFIALAPSALASVITVAECTVQLQDLSFLTTTSPSSCAVDRPPLGSRIDLMASASGSLMTQQDAPYVTSLMGRTEAATQPNYNLELLPIEDRIALGTVDIVISRTSPGPARPGLIELSVLASGGALDGNINGSWDVGGLFGGFHFFTGIAECTPPFTPGLGPLCEMPSAEFPFVLGSPFDVLFHLRASGHSRGPDTMPNMAVGSLQVDFRLMELDGTPVPTLVPVPEPQTWALTLVGLIALAVLFRIHAGGTHQS